MLFTHRLIHLFLGGTSFIVTASHNKLLSVKLNNELRYPFTIHLNSLS